MLFSIAFENGLDTFVTDDAYVGYCPIELVIADGGKTSKALSLYGYLQTLEYTFSGLINTVTGDIGDVKIGKSWCGSVIKNRTVVDWAFRMSKKRTIIYDICATSVKEKYYVASDIKLNNGHMEPKWTKSFNTTDEKILKTNMKVCVAGFNMHMKNYKLVWVEEKGRVELRNKANESINVESVVEDDIYTLLKFINCIIFRGYHLPIIFLGCKNMSREVIMAYNEIVKGMYGDTFVFMYDCPKTLPLERQTLSLPNYTLHTKMKSGKNKNSKS